MAWVRYLSVVRLERSWHCQTRNGFWSSPHIRKVWGISLLFVVPPLVGFGEYTMDASTIWYKLLLSEVSWFLSRIILCPNNIDTGYMAGRIVRDYHIVFCFSCTPYWSASTILGICYNWMLITIGFFLPTLAIISSNVLVMKTLRQVRNKYKPNI